MNLALKVANKKKGACVIPDQKRLCVEMTLCRDELPIALVIWWRFKRYDRAQRYEARNYFQARIKLEERVRERNVWVEGANTRLRNEIEEHKGHSGSLTNCPNWRVGAASVRV